MGPLKDLRVVELAGLGATPFCAMLLADLGADVIRIDRPDSVGAESFPSEPSLLRGRPSAAVDLKHPDGPELVLRLVERADALVEGYRPGVAERLGVGPDACLARNERLVYGRMTGWGQTGPYALLPGHDLNYIAISGALAAIGQRRRSTSSETSAAVGCSSRWGSSAPCSRRGAPAAARSSTPRCPMVPRC